MYTTRNHQLGFLASLMTMTLTGGRVHDRQEFETLVHGDEDKVLADKAYWSRERRQQQ